MFSNIAAKYDLSEPLEQLWSLYTSRKPNINTDTYQTLRSIRKFLHDERTELSNICQIPLMPDCTTFSYIAQEFSGHMGHSIDLARPTELTRILHTGIVVNGDIGTYFMNIAGQKQTPSWKLVDPEKIARRVIKLGEIYHFFSHSNRTLHLVRQ